MAIKKKTVLNEDAIVDPSEVVNETTVDESVGSETVHPMSGANNMNDPKTKVAAMKAVIGALAGKTEDECITFYNEMMAKLNSQAPAGGSAESNRATIKTHMKGAVKEEFIAMFSADDALTEEFKEKATTLFEAAVEAQVAAEAVRIEEEADESLAEGIQLVIDQLTEQLDTYLDYAVGEFMDENKLAIDSGLRADITEKFIEGLKDLFTENYIEVPDDKLDVLDTLATRVDELEESLDAELVKSAELQKQITEGARKEAYAEVVADLSDVQVEKFKKLAEGVDFDGDVAAYTKKLVTVKEGFLSADKKPTGQKLASIVEGEGFEGETKAKVLVEDVDPTVAMYAKALSFSSRRQS